MKLIQTDVMPESGSFLAVFYENQDIISISCRFNENGNFETYEGYGDCSGWNCDDPNFYRDYMYVIGIEE